MKNPPCQSAWRVSRKLNCELYQLFSSFLRGASRPKSPRDAGFPVPLFMREIEVFVKANLGRQGPAQQYAQFLRPTGRKMLPLAAPGPMAR